MDLQGAARKIEPGPVPAQPQPVAGHEGGAGARAAGQGGAGAPLPHPHHQVVGGEHLHEVDVGFRREGRVHLEAGTEALQVDLVDRVHRDHHVGVAHAGGSHGEGLAIHHQLALGQPVGPHLQGGGHLGRLQEGSAHVDADGAIRQQLGHDPARQGVDLPGAARAVAVAVGQEAGQAADAVAAHLRLAAVGVEDAHAQLAAGVGRQGQDHSVAADAEAAITQLRDPLRRQTEHEVRVRNGAVVEHPTIQQQKVVA